MSKLYDLIKQQENIWKTTTTTKTSEYGLIVLHLTENSELTVNTI